jgi:hypothetical protein
MGRGRLLISLKLARIAAVAACGCTLWLQAPVLDLIAVSTWLRIGFIMAIIIGALGAAQIRAWLLVPGAVAAGLTVGASWTEWRMPNDVDRSLIDSVVSAISIYGWDFIAPGVIASAIGVVVVQLLRLQRFLTAN